VNLRHPPVSSRETVTEIVNMPRTPTTKPDSHQLRAVLKDSLLYEIIHTFGIPRLLEGCPTDNGLAEVINFSRYGHARGLFQFLFRLRTDNGVRGDDVVAEDYRFNPGRYFADDLDRQARNKADLEDLHKGLLHITTYRGDPKRHKPWEPILPCLLVPTMDFMEHVLTGPGKTCDDGKDVFEDNEDRPHWKTLLAILRECQGTRQRFRFSSGVGEDKQVWYEFSLGKGGVCELLPYDRQAQPPGALLTHSSTNTNHSTATVVDLMKAGLFNKPPLKGITE